MSNPTISILSSLRFRLTNTRLARGMSVGFVADSIRLGFVEGEVATSPAVVTARFYHARSTGAAGPWLPNWVTFSSVRIALAQINPTIGDFDGNRRLVLDATAEASRRAAELVVFPEL